MFDLRQFIGHFSFSFSFYLSIYPSILYYSIKSIVYAQASGYFDIPDSDVISVELTRMFVPLIIALFLI